VDFLSANLYRENYGLLAALISLLSAAVSWDRSQVLSA
jgi:hypothetical protein